MIVTKCAWCGVTIDYNRSEENFTSHGICPECYERQKAELDKIKQMIKKQSSVFDESK